MATQSYDSYSLFQSQSLEWDAPFTGKQSCSSSQSLEDSETQQSHRNISPQQHLNPDEESPDPTAMPRMQGAPYSLEKKEILKRRSKVWQLYKVKNQRTLLQTGELLQQMEDLEKSLKPTKSDNRSPEVTIKNKRGATHGDSSNHEIEKQPRHKQLVQKMEELEESLKSKSNNHSSVTKKNTTEDEHADDSTEGSSSSHLLRNQPCHKQLGHSRNLLIQKLEYMEHQFLTMEGMQQQQKEGVHSDDSFEGSSPKQGIRKHPCHKHAEYSKDQLIQKLEEMGKQFLTEETHQRSETQKPKSYSNDREILEEWKLSVKERAKRNSVASSPRPSQTTTAKPTTISPPATNEESQRRRTMMNRKLQHQQANKFPSRVSNTSLGSYITATPLQPFPKGSCKYVVANSPLKPTAASKTISVQSRPASPLKASKLQEIFNRQREEREQRATKQRHADNSRDQIVQSLGQTRSSIQQLQKLQEKTESKLASRPTSFRRRLDPTFQRQHQHPKLFSKQKGLQTIRDARQKRLQLLQQRQQDAQRAYLMQQQKRMSDMVKTTKSYCS